MSIGLNDVVQSIVDRSLNRLYTGMPAIVTDVSKLQSQNVISVQPAIQKVRSDGESYDMPVLEDIPVQWPSGGGAIMTFPIKKDEDVWVMFSMQSMAEWWLTPEGTSKPFDRRLHNLSDAFVLPEIFRKQNQPNVNPDDVEIRYKDGEITIKEDSTVEFNNANGSYKINPAGTHEGVTSSTFSMSNDTVELVDILSQTLTEISNATVNTQIGAQPLINKSTIQSLITQLDTLKV